jgi:nucleoside-diphosphate-sugar epimerase
MRIFLTGATGFLGGHILGTLVEHGHQVTCLVRESSAQQLRALSLPGLIVVEGEFTQSASYRDSLAGHDAVVNAVGIIRETRHGSFEAVHARGATELFDAAKQAGVRKIVQISALGADEQAQSRYHISKRTADRHLAGLGVPFVVLRPSIVYGPRDHSMTYFQALAALPVTPVPGDGRYRLHPIYVADLVRAVVLAAERDDLTGMVVDVGGGEPIRFDDLLDVLARRLGKRRACKLHVPWRIMELTAAVTDALGGRGPISSEELGMLRRENFADNRPFIEHFGFTPVSIEPGQARMPLSEAGKWHARLAFLRLPLRLSIAFIWLVTGIVSAFVSSADGFRLLAQIGITGPLASLALYGTAYFEIALGLATALGWRVRLLGTIQIVLMLGFTAILTLGIPELWLHPFGPLTKNIPLLVATLVMMALESS